MKSIFITHRLTLNNKKTLLLSFVNSGILMSIFLPHKQQNINTFLLPL